MFKSTHCLPTHTQTLCAAMREMFICIQDFLSLNIFRPLKKRLSRIRIFGKEPEKKEKESDDDGVICSKLSGRQVKEKKEKLLLRSS